jgi:hypothetical protein
MSRRSMRSRGFWLCLRPGPSLILVVQMSVWVRNHLAELARRRPALIFAVGHACLLAILFADPLFVAKTFSSRDLGPFFHPIEKAVHESWRHGHVPLLLPEISFGRPLAANPNTGAFYPLRVAMAALPFPLAFKLFPLLHLWLAGLGAFLLARALGCSPPGAYLAGLVYGLCGPAICDVQFPNLLPGLSALPFVLWAAGRLARRPDWRASSLFGLFWGFDLLAGDVFTAGLALAGSFLLVWQESEPRSRGRAAVVLISGAIAAVMLAAIQIVPAFLLTPLTVRALAHFSVRSAVMWSVSAWRLLELVIPFPFGNWIADRSVWGDGLWSGQLGGFFQTFYAGAFAAAACFVVRPAKGRRLFVYGLLALSVVLSSLGHYFPESVLRLQSPIPLRYPEKLMVGAELVLALLAGMFLDSLNRSGGRVEARTAAFMAALLLGMAAAAHALPDRVREFAEAHWTGILHHGAEASRRLPHLLLNGGVTWAALACLLSLWTRDRRRTATIFAFAFVLADLAAIRWQLLLTMPDSVVLDAPPSARAILRGMDPHVFGFTPMQSYLRPAAAPGSPPKSYQDPQDQLRTILGGYTAASFRIPYVFNQDYDLSDFYRVDLTRREVTRDTAPAAQVANDLSGFSARAAIMELGYFNEAFSQPVRVVRPYWILANPRALPLPRFVRHVREVRDIAEAYKMIHGGGVDLSRVAIVESGADREGTLSGGRIRIRRMDGNGLELTTESASRTWLLIPRAYSPFREIEVDGTSSPFFAANLCLTSVALPPGRHRIQVEERLPGGSAGPSVSLAGGLLLLLWSRRKNQPGPEGRRLPRGSWRISARESQGRISRVG